MARMLSAKERFALGQERRQQMPFQVMHPQGRHAPGKGEGPGQSGARQQGPDQTGARGIGDAVDLPRQRAGTAQDLPHQRQQPLHVVTRGQFRHHAPVEAVQLDLAENGVRQQTALAVEHGNGAFIAGGFQGKNFHR